MGRRGNGEGSISRRKDGLYMGRYTIETTTGQKRKTVYGKTRAEVSEKLTKAMADRDGGLVYDADNLKVGDYLARWLKDSVRDTVRQRTYEEYEGIVHRHLVPALGRVKLKNLSPDRVRGLYREKLDSGLSPRTVQYIHVTLNKALKQAVADGLIPRNAAASVKAPRPAKKEIRPLTAVQARTLLSTVRGERGEAFYTVAIHCGLREGELLALRWEDVDLDGKNGGKLQVRRTLSQARGGHIFEPPKSGKGRGMKLTRQATDALRAHRKRQLEERMSKAGLWEDHGLVFPSTVGTPLSASNVNKAFKRDLRRAGLPESTRLHDLRHTCATLLLSRNVHPKYVQELLGHADIALTLNVYSHVIPGMDGGTAGAMEDALG